ncbi:class I SAM-dependent methyltransferase [Asticcacaulis solisilvae]|uniref:class I SAM-dependent methyltransferase n=1 Tax=Asticcacaulis solisilvae TaxID=1217274 RepID=UPI003FD6C174
MFDSLMTQLVKTGRVTVIYPDGTTRAYGAIPHDNPSLDATMRLHRKDTAARILADPYLAFGEAYMNGDLTVENGTLWGLLDVIGRNLNNIPAPPPWMRLWHRVLQAVATYNTVAASRRNVAHHYDLPDEMYRAFLDTDRQYSCAYFPRPGMSLEEAQMAKKRHLIAKLDLRAGQRVLDIGCGWGGLALEIAQAADVEVTGITLSNEQLEVARRRAEAAGLARRVQFELIDYRELDDRFDRIISVGMFEHVGPANYDTYFAKIRNLLSDDGIAVVHSIARCGTRGGSNSWIQKYIFPGGYIPSLSQVTQSTERTFLWITDVEILRLHYAETLKAWRERFMAHRDEMAGLYDERFVRMWEFYLASCEMNFRHGDLMVMQVQLARRIDAVPLARDYMFDGERDLDRPRAVAQSA